MVRILFFINLSLCAIFVTALAAGVEGGSHWSEGIYFAPQGATPSYPEANDRDSTDTVRRNPWAAQPQEYRTRRPSTYEALGYPNQGYDPYRESQVQRSGYPELPRLRDDSYPRVEEYRPIPRDYGKWGDYGHEMRGYASPEYVSPSEPAYGYPLGAYGSGIYNPYLGLSPYLQSFGMGASPWLGLMPYAGMQPPLW